MPSNPFTRAALARRLVREGVSLALVARSKEKLEALCNELNQGVNGSHALTCPLSRPRRNQLTRCCELPWVNASGTT